MIGQAERDEERVRQRTRAQDRRQHDVAGKTGDAREERQSANGEDARQHGELW
jgi:hypothetical protein